MIAARFHPCRRRPICLARPSHGDGFADLFRAPRHRPAGPRAAPPKLGANDVFAASSAHLPTARIAIPSLSSRGLPIQRP